MKISLNNKYEQEVKRIANYHPNPSRDKEVKVIKEVFQEFITLSKSNYKKNHILTNCFQFDGIYNTLKFSWYPDRYGPDHNPEQYIKSIMSQKMEIDKKNLLFRRKLSLFLLKNLRGVIDKIIGSNLSSNNKRRFELYIKDIGVQYNLIDFILWIMLPSECDQYSTFEKHPIKKRTIDELRSKLVIKNYDSIGILKNRDVYEKIGHIIDYRVLSVESEGLFRVINTELGHAEKLSRSNLIDVECLHLL